MTDQRLNLLAAAVDRLHLILCQEMAEVDTSDPEIALENIARLLGDDNLFKDPSVLARIEAELADFEADLYLFKSESRGRIMAEIKSLRELLASK